MALTDKVAFCLLADLQDDLSSTETTKLERRILAASAMIESYCGRQFQRVVGRVELLAGHGTCRLLPSLTPISSVASVEFDGDLVDSADYEVEADSQGNGWALYASTGWMWTAPGVQTISEYPVPLPGQERRAYAVTYTGGYCLPNDTVQAAPYLPVEVSEACLLLAAHLWRQRGRDGNVVAESDGDASIQLGYVGGVDSAPANHGGIPGGIAAMLERYWRMA